MAARSIGSLTISFGLVAIPVKLYTATEEKDVRFHQFQRQSKQRVQNKRVAEFFIRCCHTHLSFLAVAHEFSLARTVLDVWRPRLSEGELTLGTEAHVV